MLLFNFSKSFQIIHIKRNIIIHQSLPVLFSTHMPFSVFRFILLIHHSIYSSFPRRISVSKVFPLVFCHINALFVPFHPRITVRLLYLFISTPRRCIVFLLLLSTPRCCIVFCLHCRGKFVLACFFVLADAKKTSLILHYPNSLYCRRLASYWICTRKF